MFQLIDHDESSDAPPVATFDSQNILSITETSFLDQLVITFVFYQQHLQELHGAV
jgi:hypothetical protein